ncbi:MAG: hypothetical protein R2724_16960 [Bryobacterales bacterium]
MPFKRGFERIAHGLDVPKAGALDGVWGSLFSFSSGRPSGSVPDAFPAP